MLGFLKKILIFCYLKKWCFCKKILGSIFLQTMFSQNVGNLCNSETEPEVDLPS